MAAHLCRLLPSVLQLDEAASQGPSWMLQLLQRETSSGGDPGPALACCCPYFTAQAKAMAARMEDGGGRGEQRVRREGAWACLYYHYC